MANSNDLNEWAPVRLKASNKIVWVPRDMFNVGDTITMRQYAYESGQATKEEAGIDASAARPEVSALESIGANASRVVRDIGSNISQAYSEITGNQAGAEAAKRAQLERERLFSPLGEDRPYSSFAGEALPYFAAPGGKVAQAAFGVAEGALQGDTPVERLIGAGVGLTSAILGQKAGDYLMSRLQNKAQRMTGNVNANARRELLDLNIPMSLSQRTDGPISKPLARFFERGRFVWTGEQPFGAAQQTRMTEILADALGIKGKKLTREVLGEANENIISVFKKAAKEIGGPIIPDGKFDVAVAKAAEAFDAVGSDSPQVKKVFFNFLDLATDPNGINPAQYLHMRSNLSAATTKTDIETSAVVDAINAMDDLLARQVPKLADELRVARDRFRLMLAVRQGASLSPQGDINLPTLTRNLERIFRDFDVGKPLPRTLRDAGEGIASLNQIAMPFRSSGTAENALSAAIPGGAATDPNALLRFLMGASAPFAGGGTGGLLGGGAARAGSSQMLDEFYRNRTF